MMKYIHVDSTNVYVGGEKKPIKNRYQRMYDILHLFAFRMRKGGIQSHSPKWRVINGVQYIFCLPRSM